MSDLTTEAGERVGRDPGATFLNIHRDPECGVSGPHTRHRLVGGNYNTNDDIDIAFVCHVAFLSYWVILITYHPQLLF